MADEESIDPVELAGRSVWGAVAEGLALLDLARLSDDDGAVRHLAVAILERLTTAVDEWHGAMLRHGFKPIHSRETNGDPSRAE